MRKIIILVMCSFFAHNTFAQSERNQKIQKVEEKRSSTTTTNTTTTTTTTNNNYNQGYRNGYNNGVWNNRNRTQYYYNPYEGGYYPYWNTNRRWDNRNYVMTTNSDLVRNNPKKPMRLSLGVMVESDIFQRQISPYIITGGETFMIIQYHMTLPLIYPYYENISTWEVEDWGDESAGGVEVKSDFSIGAGRTIDRLSPFITVGISSRRKYDAYYDELFLLSSKNQDGIYLINEQKQVNMSIRGGLLYHWEYLEIISQLRYDGRFGIGVGVGLKL